MKQFSQYGEFKRRAMMITASYHDSSDSCLDCEAGYYQDAQGSRSCKLCGRGSETGVASGATT